MGDTIHDDVAAGRFEMPAGGLVSFVNYRRAAQVLTLTHAEVPPSLEGQGVGSRLVRGVLELVRARGETVVPRCPFIARYIERHPEYADLLAPRS
jgi:predicted GNAT family acetyltransferase